MARSDPRRPILITSVQPQDELPDDSLADVPRVEWEKTGEFRGTVSSATINNSGDLTFTIKVPFEDKYAALPVTDTRGVLMVWSVYKPVEVEDDGGGYRSDDLDAQWG